MSLFALILAGFACGGWLVLLVMYGRVVQQLRAQRREISAIKFADGFNIIVGRAVVEDLGARIYRVEKRLDDKSGDA